MKNAPKNWVKPLLSWFEKEQRALPWRKNYELYEVWISEIMLQQTKVETVLPYFHAFLQKFPTVQALAKAPLEEVLAMWEGLGYYRRARNLHAAAQMIAQEGFPQSKEEWQKLPGVGDYTSSAIVAIALQQKALALDGNLERVGARLWDIAGSIHKKSLSDKFLEEFEATDSRNFNQALMELGALVCTKMAPKCHACPIQEHCLAFQRQTVAERPPVKKRPASIYQDVAVGILIDETGLCFIQKRAENQSLAGLWEFPGGKCEEGESPEEALKREITEEICFEVKQVEFLGVVKQFFTHHKIRLHAYLVSVKKAEKASIQTNLEHTWVPLENLDHFPMPKANRKLVNILKKCYNV